MTRKPGPRQHRKSRNHDRQVVLAAANTANSELPGGLIALLVLVPVLFNAVMLWPELMSAAPTRNDSAFHLLMINGASDALAHGQNPLDFWIPQLELGFPQFLYYQNFPHLVVVALHRVLFGAVTLETIFNISRYLLLVAFPLTVYWSMRRIGFSAVACATSAAASSLLSTDARYGFEYNSYVWRGFGLYTQLWGMHLSFIAVACLHHALKNGRGYVLSIVSLALLALSHLLLAYMMGITGLLVLVSVSERRTWWRQFVRFASIGVSAVLVSSYMLIPFALSSGKYMSRLPENNSTPVRPDAMVDWLVTGKLFDFGRLPVLTLLIALGVVVAIAGYRRASTPANRFALGGLLVWLVLYVVHPTVGPLAKLFPVHAGYVTSRFISTVDLFAILVIGVAGEWIWQKVASLRPRVVVAQAGPSVVVVKPLFAVVAIFAALLPAFVERAHYYATNRAFIVQTRDALAANADLQQIFSTLKQQPGGRLYAGLRNNWGAQMHVGPTLVVTDLVRYAGIASVGPIYQALSMNASLLWEFREGDEALFDVMDVRWVLTPAGATVPAFYKQYHQTKNYALYRIPTSGIAEYVTVSERRAVQTQRELYEGNRAWYTSDAMNTRQLIRWDYMTKPGEPVHTERCAGGGSITGEKIEAGRVHIEAECPTASSLALKLTYHPNWRVTVDDKRVDTFMLSPSFIGIDLPPGRHAVDAVYAATSAKVPLLVLGLLVLALWVVFRNRLPPVFNASHDNEAAAS